MGISSACHLLHITYRPSPIVGLRRLIPYRFHCLLTARSPTTVSLNDQWYVNSSSRALFYYMGCSLVSAYV
jgi:hypothetical protein